ncbi:hypothetical protein Gotri_021192 [Gossypium trilobum]|uniref:Homeobox domain-containing protein n=3 Tax=Gossypium TaxID=3633 RepID=A0A7J9DBX9_9ROSI|nr:hypothetical protein [Gossypium trilobum]
MIMEWEDQENQNQREILNVNVNNGGVMYVKVMTDEQLETLREQIAVYAAICEQLVEMHKNLTAQQDLAGLSLSFPLISLYACHAQTFFMALPMIDSYNTPPTDHMVVGSFFLCWLTIDGTIGSVVHEYVVMRTQCLAIEKLKEKETIICLAGGRLGSLYCDPLMTSAGHKITARQRWTPTPVQLQILERIFDQGTGTPSKQKIKEITSELSQHGQISETNVYNWFQNRRARSKRKQLGSSSNNAESELETEVESPNEKKTKPENLLSGQNPAPRAEDLCFQNPEITSELHFLGVMSNPTTFNGDEHLSGKMGMPGSYNIYDQAGDYGMAG